MSKAFNNATKLNDIVSVKDFGAKGDGTTDDTAAIQAAINSFNAVRSTSPATLVFPAGKYRVTASSVPSVTASAAGNFTVTGASTITPTAIALATNAGNHQMVIDSTVSGATAGQGALLRYANTSAYLDFSAEL